MEVTQNPNVLWGLGGKFAIATPIPGFQDRYDVDTGGYLYFLGSGELWSDIDLSVRPYALLATGSLYMARVEASANAVASGDFEYFTGFAGGLSQWAGQADGGYDRAVPVHELPGVSTRVGSVTKRGDTYYLAARRTD